MTAPRTDHPDAVLVALDEASAPLCDRCGASFRAPGDTLCAACRHDVDLEYGALPGAEP